MIREHEPKAGEVELQVESYRELELAELDVQESMDGPGVAMRDPKTGELFVLHQGI